MTRFRWFFIFVNLIFVVGLFFLIRTRGEIYRNVSSDSLPSYGAVPDFTLTERSGSPVSLSDLKNKVWVADFIFTRCAGQCPLMSQKLNQLQRKLKGVQFVSFSVDPGTDTPKVLSDYAKLYSADPEKWFFLTGDKDILNHVAQGFHVVGLGDPMFHSVSFALVDKMGQIRGYYDSNDNERMKSLRRDIKELLK